MSNLKNLKKEIYTFTHILTTNIHSGKTEVVGSLVVTCFFLNTKNAEWSQQERCQVEKIE